MNLFFHIGRYFLMLKDVFSKPEKTSIFFKQTVREIEKLGINSLGIISIISIFMGAVIVLQMASNIDSPFIPLYTIGYATRQSVVLEFSPTIISLILAGKVGSNIASEIGTMKVTEQIDALEMMGVNSKSYLVLPKIAALVFINPFLVIISMGQAIVGGWAIGIASGVVNSYEYKYGIKFDFDAYTIVYALIKTAVFAFIIASIPAYQGYYTKGGALEVGVSSTRAVVNSSVVILISNYLLTQLLLI